jgi:hypothetical protein
MLMVDYELKIRKISDRSYKLRPTMPLFCLIVAVCNCDALIKAFEMRNLHF